MTRIIVEGPDGSGKTSMISRLRSWNPNALMASRACTSENGPIAALKQWIDDDVENEDWEEGEIVIYDRHPLISEPIYGPLIRGYIDPGLTDRTWLGSAYQAWIAHNPIIIYCLPPYPIVYENILKTHQGSTKHLQGVVQHAMAIYDSYTVLACKQAGRPLTMVWDYTQPENLHDILACVEGK